MKKTQFRIEIGIRVKIELKIVFDAINFFILKILVS